MEEKSYYGLYWVSMIAVGDFSPCFSVQLFAHPCCAQLHHQSNFFTSYSISGLLKCLEEKKKFEIKSRFLFDFYDQNSRHRTPKIMNWIPPCCQLLWGGFPFPHSQNGGCGVMPEVMQSCRIKMACLLCLSLLLKIFEKCESKTVWTQILSNRM